MPLPGVCAAYDTLFNSTGGIAKTCQACCNSFFVGGPKPAAAVQQQPQQQQPPGSTSPPPPPSTAAAIALGFLSVSGGNLLPAFNPANTHYLVHAPLWHGPNVTAVVPPGKVLSMQCWSDMAPGAAGAFAPTSPQALVLADGHALFTLPPTNEPQLCELNLNGLPPEHRALATLLVTPRAAIPAPTPPAAAHGGSNVFLVLFGALLLVALGALYHTWSKAERARERRRLVSEFGGADPAAGFCDSTPTSYSAL